MGAEQEGAEGGDKGRPRTLDIPLLADPLCMGDCHLTACLLQQHEDVAVVALRGVGGPVPYVCLQTQAAKPQNRLQGPNRSIDYPPTLPSILPPTHLPPPPPVPLPACRSSAHTPLSFPASPLLCSNQQPGWDCLLATQRVAGERKAGGALARRGGCKDDLAPGLPSTPIAVAPQAMQPRAPSPRSPPRSVAGAIRGIRINHEDGTRATTDP